MMAVLKNKSWNTTGYYFALYLITRQSTELHRFWDSDNTHDGLKFQCYKTVFHTTGLYCNVTHFKVFTRL